MYLCSTLYFYNTDLVFNVSAKIYKTFAVNQFLWTWSFCVIHKNTAIFITKKCGDVFENELYAVCLKMFMNYYVNVPLKAKTFQRFLKADQFFFPE